MEKPQVLLIYPKTGVDFGSSVAPPHAVLSIAAPVLKAGYRVKVLDQRVEPVNRQVLEELISSDLICVGVSSMTGHQILHSIKITGIIRELTDGAVPLVWGGAHPSTDPGMTVLHNNVDVVVIGEGEEPFLELVKAYDRKESIGGIASIMYQDGGEIVRTDKRPLLNIEELLPVPWELIDVEKYIHRDMYVKGRYRVLDIGQTSRGCPFDCGFCSSATIRERRWRAMSVEKSLSQIVETVRRFNLDGFWLRDDEFYIQRDRAHGICEGMIESGLDVSFYTSGTRVDVFNKSTDDQLKILKRAGAHTLKFGAESGSQRVLDIMQKGITVEQTIKANLKCKEFGFIPAFSLMIGYPTETFEDMNKTIDLAFRLMKENPAAQTECIATFTTFPGTPSYHLAKEHGFVGPQSLEEWGGWVLDEYDLEGIKIPWYNRQERISIGNISYISILSNGLENIMDSLPNPVLRYPLKWIARIVGYYYTERLRAKKYHFVPELPFIRALRNEWFYKGASGSTG